METPTPTRHRRSDRYRQPSAAQMPVPAGEERPAGAAAPVPAAPRPAAPARPLPRPDPGARPVSAVPRPARLPQREEAGPPPAMDRPKRAVRTIAPKKAAPRMPAWLIAALCVAALALGALFAGECMLRAYLTQREEEKAAAYQAVVDAHPLAYQELIERYAAENNLQPAFVAAIILNESSYRTDAESSVGARGLMQLMPDTAQWIADKLDVEHYSFALMYDAETNIRFGTWYLGYLGELFQGDPTLVACAFHAGQGEVRGWLGDPALSEDGVTLRLENLADGPTKSYAGRVTRDYGIYQALYFTQPAQAPGPAADAAAVPALALRPGR